MKSVGDFKNLELSDDIIKTRYKVKDNYQWKVEQQRQKTSEIEIDSDLCLDIFYRPFDTRKIYYDDDIVFRTRRTVMQHMVAEKNVGLVTVRQVAEGKFNHTIAVDKIIESRMTLSNKGIGYLFPLYRYENEMGETTRHENLNPKFRRWLDNRYGKAHTPEDILGCIYAILHSPDYRNRYADFLRTDFPRIPFPAENAEFTRLAIIGSALINAHLLRTNHTGELAQHNGIGTSHLVEKIRYDEKTERLYFNKTEYFAPIPPEVFNFQIGGYQPLDKYLKSRKNRTLTLPETSTIQKAANVIAFTIGKMREIDG